MVFEVFAYLFGVAIVIIIQRSLVNSKIRDYGEVLCPISFDDKKTNRRRSLALVLAVGFSICCYLSIKFFAVDFAMPVWLFAIACGLFAGKYIYSFIEFKDIKQGLYEDKLIVNSRVYDYSWFKEYTIETKRGKTYATLLGTNGTRIIKPFVVDQAVIKEFDRIMATHNIKKVVTD